MFGLFLFNKRFDSILSLIFQHLFASKTIQNYKTIFFFISLSLSVFFCLSLSFLSLSFFLSHSLPDLVDMQVLGFTPESKLNVKANHLTKTRSNISGKFSSCLFFIKVQLGFFPEQQKKYNLLRVNLIFKQFTYSKCCCTLPN